MELKNFYELKPGDVFKEHGYDLEYLKLDGGAVSISRRNNIQLMSVQDYRYTHNLNDSVFEVVKNIGTCFRIDAF